MKISRLMPALIACFCAYTSIAAAELSVKVADLDRNRICVSGKAKSEAALLIVNPGFTEEDVQNGAEGAIQYFRTKRADNGSYNFDVEICGPQSGEYTVIVNADGTVEKTAFELYSGNKKLSIWRSLDRALFYKVSDSADYQPEQLPYPQYFKSVSTDASGTEESSVETVAASVERITRSFYYNCDFGDDFTVSGNTIQQNGSKVFDLSGSDAASRIKLLGGALDMDYSSAGNETISSSLMARHTIVTSTGDLKGTDSGIITTEADIRLGGSRAAGFIQLQLQADLTWSNMHRVNILVDSDKIIKISYTDIDNISRTLSTGIVWEMPAESKHFKISLNVDDKTVEVNIDGQIFIINDIKSVAFIQCIAYIANPYGIAVSNASCCKYETVPFETGFGYAEKLYFAASDADNSLESGTAVTVAYTNDGEAREYTLIAAAYEENGALAETVVMPVSLTDGTGKAYTAYFDGEYPRERIKVYLWNAEKIKPVLKKALFSEKLLVSKEFFSER